LANITVKNSQIVMDQSNLPGCAIDSIRVTTVPTSTTNMTGFLICHRGSSFLKASISARPMISRSKRLRDPATPCGRSLGWDCGCVVTVVIRRTFRG